MASQLNDIETLMQMGFDPKTGLPFKLNPVDYAIKDNIKKVLRIKDEQTAVRRYKWYNLPDGLEDILERVLYYKGQGMFFYNEDTGHFMFLPYCLEGEIDCYGRYIKVTPLPFTGVAEDKAKKSSVGKYLQMYARDVLYTVPIDADPVKSCVILSDYSKQISQTTLPRQMLNDPLLDTEAELIPYMRTSLKNSTGVTGMRITDSSEVGNVVAANQTSDIAALTGQKYVPINGRIEFQELTGSTALASADFMQALESLENFRLSLYGIDNGGLFQKKAHMLQQEQAMAGGATDVIYNDGLMLRQNFCNMVNLVWGLGIWCDRPECIEGDMNGDGIISDTDTDAPVNAPEGGNDDISE